MIYCCEFFENLVFEFLKCLFKSNCNNSFFVCNLYLGGVIVVVICYMYMYINVDLLN